MSPKPNGHGGCLISGMSVLIGTSGWLYRHWNGLFYPRGVSNRFLYYAERFQTVELNVTFYRLPERSVFEKWQAIAPADFVFASKASRFLTHLRRLKDPEEPVSRQMERTDALASKMGPILIQLPGNFHRSDDRLVAVLRAFPPGIRIAVEFRHESWFDDAVRRILEGFGAALCVADRDSRLVTPLWRTADWGYIRFHHGTSFPRPCYHRKVLAERASQLAEQWSGDQTVFVYFNNDGRGCALRDASWFAAELDRLGIPRSRVPEALVPEREEPVPAG